MSNVLIQQDDSEDKVTVETRLQKIQKIRKFKKLSNWKNTEGEINEKQ